MNEENTVILPSEEQAEQNDRDTRAEELESTFSYDGFQEKVGSSWKKILWYSGNIAFIFSISIELLQLFLRLGTFQLSDLFYNTVGGVLGGLMYYTVMKVRKHL